MSVLARYFMAGLAQFSRQVFCVPEARRTRLGTPVHRLIHALADFVLILILKFLKVVVEVILW